MHTEFEIIPAIDLIGGKCVRLTQGDFSSAKEYSANPLEVALRFQDAGLRRLHMVDLDGARMGAVAHLNVLEAIATHTDLVIDYGGGISSLETLQSVFNAGARYVSIGSMAVRRPDVMEKWIQNVGAERFFLGADVVHGFLAIGGWKEVSEVHIQEFISHWTSKSIHYFFSTDVGRDGMLSGPSIELYKTLLSNHPGIRLVASGGVRSVRDLETLKALGCSGAIIGKALYEGHLSLKD
ncbi:1-(5-phosphoribosyl)-5-[(5-phosphoribosylamino) me thylideneamino] imidazole-4-carboxamide isomerase [Thermaurantimonas aggregans]|uniref:1-(5-phosphoribosyl)-5-[(5-phosphoribosylamino)methylideneamino] imidazole-4-carboxamide isomerase n=1 Tax=Thermaurantimonas aggregans TaxID=2173829 RepID=A0A401XJQ6_9FLAO|nr:1-(5-phosphoribosyl)-5-[(5-phosphoribosylamino)methylideneamino] imidazole-4-carboxamide isomerase [Thermaurantimonas aggregans]GCD77242.1 1-(5-phosphoribosyl)-5-[(5-phosphoribosylamino) me thylideneamino] imidazole-4-carboxamide isomerase [Thermaurantimonas aggregans]